VALSIGLIPIYREKNKNKKLANVLRDRILYELHRLPTQIVYKEYKKAEEKIEYVNDKNKEFFHEVLNSLKLYSVDIWLLSPDEANSLISIILALRKGFDLGGYLPIELYTVLLREIVKLQKNMALKRYGKQKAKEFELQIYLREKNGLLLKMENPFEEE